MRTKTLLLAAATLVAGIVGASAQVYSQNIVGYINLSLNSGLNLVANQLNVSGGTNSIQAVLPTVPTDTLVYKFLPNGTFKQDVFSPADGGWIDNVSGLPSTTTLSPGEGFFISVPSPTTVTLVGEVKTGQSTVVLNQNLTLVSSVVPASYTLVSPDFPAADGMLYYKFLPNQTFEQDLYSPADGGWIDNVSGLPAVVQPAVGAGFFLANPGSPVNWTRTFTP